MIIFTNMTISIQMKDPELQDTYVLRLGPKVKTMMDGTIRSRRQTPATTHFGLHWRELTRPKAVELQNFLIVTSGQQLRYIDYEGNSWIGYILTDPAEIVTDSLGHGTADCRNEANSVALDFEGTKL